MNRAERRRAASVQRAKAKTHRWWLRKEAAKAERRAYVSPWTAENTKAGMAIVERKLIEKGWMSPPGTVLPEHIGIPLGEVFETHEAKQ